MISNKYVDEYINLWKQGKIILNKERIDLFNYLQKHIYSRDDVYFDEQKIEDYIWLGHSFVRQGFLDDVKLEPPIKEWEKMGLLTIVDDDVIEIEYIVDWFLKAREKIWA